MTAGPLASFQKLAALLSCVVFLLSSVFLLLSSPFYLLSQEVTATIDGAVLDPEGSAVPGAEVTATHLETGVVRKGRAGGEGTFSFPALPIGGYEIAASHPGFKKAMKRGIELHIGDHLRVEIPLQVGDVAQEVTVTADALQVQTETSEQGGLISGEQVRELQLNGRSFMQLVELLPGVASDMPDRVDPNTNPALSINGGRSSSNTFNIDGSNNSDVIVGSGSLNTFTSVDTIQEFKVVTSTFAAEYGKGGFAQVNVVTRGGTKRFRGSLFYFHRNDALDARDYFSHQVLPLKLNNFGYTLHGPVLFPGYNQRRGKTFFFWAQEFNYISTRGAAVNTTVPNPEFKRGDFSALGPGPDGAFGTEDDRVVDPATGLGFPGGIIPASRLNPDALKLLALYPDPNFRGPGTINFTSASASRQNWREEMIRIDHHFSPGWKMYGRYVQDSAEIRNPYGGSSTTSIGTRFPGISATRAARPGKNLTVNMTSVLSTTLLNEFSFAYAGREITQNPSQTVATREGLGIDIPELFPENDGDVIPTITLGSNYAALNVSRVWLKQLFNLEWTNNLTKVAGRHTFKAGVLYTYGGNRENPTGPNTNGNFTFNTQLAKHPVANLLLGLPFSYSEAEHFVVSHARFSGLEWFVQDDFRVRPRFVLNYGLRVTNYYNPWDVNNVLTNFVPGFWDPAQAPQINPRNGQRIPGTGDPLNGLIIAGANSPWSRRVTNNNSNLLGPRFGFAWDIFGKGKTALRGGYGINYTRPLIGTFINSAFSNPPFSRSVTIQLPSFADPGGGTVAPQPTPSLTILNNPILSPNMQQWSLGIQQELPGKILINAAYVGSRGNHLFRPTNLNNPAPGSATPGININTFRPYQGWGSITARESSAFSFYNSMQISVNRRVSKTFTFGIAYTLARGFDNASSDRGGSDIPPDTRNARAEWGLSDSDRRHIWTSNYIWVLPQPVGRRTFFAPLLNGWQLSGITRLWSGTPFDVTMSSDVAGIGSTQNQRPDLIADPRGPRTVEDWFNRDAFARPATGTFGNMRRNSLRRPGVDKWDIAIFKNFFVGERRRQVQFRAEAFNAINHPSFSTLGTSLNTTATRINPAANSFAVVTGTRDARVLQFALKTYF